MNDPQPPDGVLDAAYWKSRAEAAWEREDRLGFDLLVARGERDAARAQTTAVIESVQGALVSCTVHKPEANCGCMELAVLRVLGIARRRLRSESPTEQNSQPIKPDATA